MSKQRDKPKPREMWAFEGDLNLDDFCVWKRQSDALKLAVAGERIVKVRVEVVES